MTQTRERTTGRSSNVRRSNDSSTKRRGQESRRAERSGEGVRASERPESGSRDLHPLLRLQESHGNQAVQHLVRNGLRDTGRSGSSERTEGREEGRATGGTTRVLGLTSGGQPLDAETRSVMERRFGHGFGNVRVHDDEAAAQSARKLEAAAYAVGRDVVFSSGQYAPETIEGQALLAHELTHVVQTERAGREAPLGTGEAVEYEVSQGTEAAEVEAERATDAVLLGERAQVSATPVAAIHRFESAEHMDAVDAAAERLRGNNTGSMNEDSLALMSQQILLENGVQVTPGQITAMMGDFYGVFDDEGQFDPGASFKQLNNADPKEMRLLVDAINREAQGENIGTSEWQKITGNRYLELARRNDSHFTGETMEGTNNNMGAYTALHQMALEAAQSGDTERAKALEASSMHYLTDRHAAGHAFVKEGVMEASGYDNSTIANLFAKVVHDEYNEGGLTVSNAAGEEWRAFGDGHWTDGANAENRLRTATSVYSSYNELQQVMSGERGVGSFETYAAHGTVPQFSRENQDAAEQRARDLDLLDVGWDLKGEGIEMLKNWVVDKASDAWDWTTGKASDAWDWTTNTASGAWDAASGAASDAWDWTTGTASDIGGAAADTASDAWDWTTDTASGAWDATSGAASDAWDWTRGTFF